MRVGQNLGQEIWDVLKKYDIKRRLYEFTEHRLKVEGINPLWSLGHFDGKKKLGVAPRSSESYHY